jgi:hypothetical protein
LNVQVASLDTGDEVSLTDSTYVGLINRVRLAGASAGGWDRLSRPNGW